MFREGNQNPLEKITPASSDSKPEDLSRESHELSPEEEIILANAKKQVDQKLGISDLSEQENFDLNMESDEINPEAEKLVKGINEQIERQQNILEQTEQSGINNGEKPESPKKKKGKIATIILLAFAIAAGSMAGKTKEAYAGSCDWGEILKHTVGKHLIHDPVRGLGRGIEKNLEERGKMERTRQKLVLKATEDYNKRVEMANGNPYELKKAEMEYRLKLQAIEEQYGK